MLLDFQGLAHQYYDLRGGISSTPLIIHLILLVSVDPNFCRAASGGIRRHPAASLCLSYSLKIESTEYTTKTQAGAGPKAKGRRALRGGGLGGSDRGRGAL